MRILCGIVRIESGCFSLLYWSAEKYREAVAGGIVYGAVHPAAAHQGRVGRIDDGVRLLKDDAVMNDLNRFHLILSFGVLLLREMQKSPIRTSREARYASKSEIKMQDFIRYQKNGFS